MGEVKINGSSHIFLEKTEMGGGPFNTDVIVDILAENPYLFPPPAFGTLISSLFFRGVFRLLRSFCDVFAFTLLLKSQHSLKIL